MSFLISAMCGRMHLEEFPRPGNRLAVLCEWRRQLTRLRLRTSLRRESSGVVRRREPTSRNQLASGRWGQLVGAASESIGTRRNHEIGIRWLRGFRLCVRSEGKRRIRRGRPRWNFGHRIRLLLSCERTVCARAVSSAADPARRNPAQKLKAALDDAIAALRAAARGRRPRCGSACWRRVVAPGPAAAAAAGGAPRYDLTYQLIEIDLASAEDYAEALAFVRLLNALLEASGG